MPYRVLHLHWAGGVGGIERGIATLAKHLDRSRFELTVALLNHSGSVLSPDSLAPARVLDFGWRSGFAPRKSKELERFLREEGFDLIHNHLRTWMVGGRLERLEERPPLIMHEHGLLLYDPEKSVKMYGRYGHLYDRFIVTNSAMEQRLATHVPESVGRTVRIPNPVDTDIFRPGQGGRRPRGSRFVIGGAGRLDPDKDWGFFIDTAKALSERPLTYGSDLEFRILGDGPDREVMMERIRDLDMEDRFTLLPETPDPASFYQDLDVFLFTSRREDFGMVNMEALASGVPVVAAPVLEGGARKLLDSLKGVLVATARDPEMVAQLIMNLVEDGRKRAALKRSGRAHVDSRFGAVAWAQTMADLYLRLMEPDKPATE